MVNVTQTHRQRLSIVAAHLTKGSAPRSLLCMMLAPPGWAVHSLITSPTVFPTGQNFTFTPLQDALKPLARPLQTRHLSDPLQPRPKSAQLLEPTRIIHAECERHGFAHSTLCRHFTGGPGASLFRVEHVLCRWPWQAAAASLGGSKSLGSVWAATQYRPASHRRLRQHVCGHRFRSCCCQRAASNEATVSHTAPTLTAPSILQPEQILRHALIPRQIVVVLGGGGGEGGGCRHRMVEAYTIRISWSGERVGVHQSSSRQVALFKNPNQLPRFAARFAVSSSCTTFSCTSLNGRIREPVMTEDEAGGAPGSLVSRSCVPL